ncbi:MAG: ABC transporter ATP-binding protein [Rhodobacteraceae bacterium]|nr:ABC transporter ATP-binding protein [Paracoccaceae bacterium]
MALLILDKLQKTYGQTAAVHPTDLSVDAGDFLAVLGPSGCGKTTLLRMIGGFVAPTAVRIHVGGQDVTGLPPERRPTNMVFQGYGLFPHMSVRQNIAYGPKVAGWPAAQIASAVDDMLALGQLEKFADRPVTDLSGGQRQRVALVRALILKPQVLLLDEPLGALDAALRASLQDELRQIHRQIGGTFVFVTHDQQEAMAMANRVAVMNDGRIAQVDSPQTIYGQPADPFVATFIGEAALLPVTVRQGRVRLPGGREAVVSGADGPRAVVLRPGDVAPAPAESPADLTVNVTDSVFQGGYNRLSLRTADGLLLRADVAVGVPLPAPGESIGIVLPARPLHTVKLPS